MDATRPVILVVDDEPLLRMNAAELLADEGYEVLEAASVDAALRIIAACADVRVVFSDIHMPGRLNGLDLAKLLDEACPQISLIITSRRINPEIGDLPQGVSFMSKPHRGQDLVQRVRGLLQRAAQRH